jgi:hypothetical protein
MSVEVRQVSSKVMPEPRPLEHSKKVEEVEEGGLYKSPPDIAKAKAYAVIHCFGIICYRNPRPLGSMTLTIKMLMNLVDFLM